MRLRVCVLVLLFCLLLALVPELGAQERSLVPPAGKRSWEMMKASGALLGEGEVPGRPVSAPRRGPDPRPVPEPEGASIVWPDTPPVSGSREGLEAVSSAAVLAPSLSFQALPDNNSSIPPDTYGSVGTSHVMTMLNSQVRVQSKTGTVLSTVSLRSFWSALNGTPFDPRVIYDSYHQRWIASCASTDGNDNDTSYVNLAVSATSDPTGTWVFYQFTGDSALPGKFADYPCLGFNRTWIALTANMFTTGSTPSYLGARMWVIDKASALSGGALTVTTYRTGFDLVAAVSGFTLQPVVTYGTEPSLYVVDNTGYFRVSDSTYLLRVSRITGTGPSPVWNVLTPSVNNAGLFLVLNKFNTVYLGAPQPAGSPAIDVGDTRMLSAVFRNGRIWCTHTGTLPGKPTSFVNRNAVFWYSLNPAAMPSPIVQSGVIDGGTGIHHYYPSIAVNALNDAVVGFTRSDALRFAEAVYTGRLSGDPAGTMHALTVFKTGESTYSKFFSGSRNRWGDYSNTCVDPVDSTSFWTIQQYAATKVGSGTNDGRWGTWWARIEPSTELGVLDEGELPRETELLQNYPNPFNPSTTIEFRLAAAGHATLTAYDMLGRKVGDIFDGVREAGTHAVVWEPVGLASGVYYCRLESGGAVDTKRLMLLR